MEEESLENFYEQIESDSTYQSTTLHEQKCQHEYEVLELSPNQKFIIEKWIDAIGSKYNVCAVFYYKLGMKHFFSLLRQLAGLK